MTLFKAMLKQAIVQRFEQEINETNCEVKKKCLQKKLNYYNGGNKNECH